MNGNTIDEFINSLFINCDKEFLYKDKRYMLQGWLNKDGTYTLRMNEISEESPVVFLVTNKDSRNLRRLCCLTGRQYMTLKMILP